MKKEINIAAILKGKAVGTKLWTDMFGEVTLYVVTEACNRFQVKHHNKEPWFEKDGRLYDEGSLCIYPSRNMRDWSKFAWKKGDVLTDNATTICIFDSWANDDYTEFNAKYTLHLIASSNTESEVCKTNDFVPVVKDEDKQSYLATAETYFNVNLTKGSMWIEKPQFKDGDIVFYEDSEHEEVCSSIFIFRGKQNHTPRFLYHAVLDSDGFFNAKDGSFGIYEGKLRLATDSEKQQLFDALAKENKAWDAGKKQIVDLPKKCEFKPFDKVLCRNSKDDVWEADFFSRLTQKEIDFTASNKYLCIGDLWMYCIPYNDQTAHLLGTTDDWKGGEG